MKRHTMPSKLELEVVWTYLFFLSCLFLSVISNILVLSGIYLLRQNLFQASLLITSKFFIFHRNVDENPRIGPVLTSDVFASLLKMDYQ